MKKMNIRQAFARMKKMFPEARVSAEKTYTRPAKGIEYSYCELYVCMSGNSGGIWILSKPTFEEAFEDLNGQLKNLR